MMDAPRAGTPLMDSNSRFVSNSHTIEPVAAEYARSEPSFEPENTAPGIIVTAADCAALHPRPLAQVGCAGGANQTRSPVVRRTA